MGKSVIGKELAKQMDLPFVDLDEEVQKAHLAKVGEKLNCRQIMLKVGQQAFRDLEHESLKAVLANTPPVVIALGGGAPMHLLSRPLIAEHTAILVQAPKTIVFERIMINGRPAFFSADESPLQSFNRIWAERAPIYEALAKIKTNNSGSIEQAVEQIKLAIINQPV